MLFFVHVIMLLIIAAESKTFMLPVASTKMYGDNNNNYYLENCISKCDENHTICLELCMKIIKNINVNKHKKLSNASRTKKGSIFHGPIISSTTTTTPCPKGKEKKRDGKCRLTHHSSAYKKNI